MNRAWVWIRGQFWALPMLCAIVAAVLGLTLSTLDDSLNTPSTLPFLFAGGPEGARALSVSNRYLDDLVHRAGVLDNDCGPPADQ